MSAHKEISHKVREPTRSENARLTHSNAVCIFCMRFERIISSIMLIFQRKNFSSSAITQCQVLMRVKTPRMRVKDLIAIWL